jgi:hypothetical protein
MGWGSYESVIEFAGGRDPEEFGFQSIRDLTERAVSNSQRTGFDAISLLSNDQGTYYRKLTNAQAYAAVRKGWKLDVTMMPVEGGGGAGLDLAPAGVRYTVSVYRNSMHHQVVQLITQVAKGYDGPSYELPGPEDAWHDYQLVFDPAARSARLNIDGVERLRGYGGYREYLGKWGLQFGVAVYRSARAEAMFKRIRFEILH